MINADFEALGLNQLDLIILYDGKPEGRTGLYMGGYVPNGSIFLFAPSDDNGQNPDADVVLLVDVQMIMKL